MLIHKTKIEIRLGGKVSVSDLIKGLAAIAQTPEIVDFHPYLLQVRTGNGTFFSENTRKNVKKFQTCSAAFL
jgi:hypothetical protein